MAKFEIATCAISGAVGTFSNVAPDVEAYVAEKLGLAVEPVSTQVIPRDRHAAYFAALAVVASSSERLASRSAIAAHRGADAESPFDAAIGLRSPCRTSATPPHREPTASRAWSLGRLPSMETWRFA